jgi:hypothetical protein
MTRMRLRAWLWRLIVRWTRRRHDEAVADLAWEIAGRRP